MERWRAPGVRSLRCRGPGNYDRRNAAEAGWRRRSRSTWMASSSAAVRPLNGQKLKISPPKPAPQMARAPIDSYGVRLFWQAKTSVTPVGKYDCRTARPIGYSFFRKPIRMLSRDLALCRPGLLRVLSNASAACCARADVSANRETAAIKRKRTVATPTSSWFSRLPRTPTR